MNLDLTLCFTSSACAPDGLPLTSTRFFPICSVFVDKNHYSGNIHLRNSLPYGTYVLPPESRVAK
jgi:hypothetical protein